MADNKKIYTIQINGIEQSIKQVDALSDALKFLDTKIKELDSRNVSVTSSSNGAGGNRAAELQTEDKLLKQIQSTEQQIRDARREDYQSLLAQKDILKDIVSEAQERAAAERLSSGNYGNTMKGLKQELSDIKKVMQTTDLGDEKFQEMTQRANELTNKLKELEQAYGQFGRNVGNYKSAFDDVKKVTVQVGNTAREFNSVRDASRQLTQELKAMTIAGQEDTKEYKDLAEAVHNFEMASRRAESAVNDLKASSQGMDDIMDMMESFGSIGQVTQGFSAFFGFDDTEIERSIQKLVGLQNAMQGIEKIRQQLNTQEGIGAILTKGNDKIDAMAFRLNRMNVAMLGTGRAAKVAAVGIKALSTAVKGIATLGLAVIIDLLVEGIDKLAEFVTNWVKGDAELISSTSALNSVIQKQNEILDKNLDLIQKRQDAGELSVLDARIEKEKAFAKALLESRDALNAREKSYQEADIVQSGKTDVYLANAMGDKGVTSLGGFSEGIKSINEFADRFDYLLGRVQNGQDIFGGWLDTVSDANDELVHITKLVGGDFINAMNKFADGTEEGSRKLAAYIAKMDELTNGKYSQAIKIGIDEGYFDGQLKQSWELYQRFKKDVALDPIEVRINFENLANQFIEAADKTKTAYYQRMRDQLDAAWNALSADEQARQKETYDKARAAINKQENDTRKSVIQGERRTADERRKKLEAAEKELNSLRIAQMQEGLNKTLKQLEEERRQRIEKARQNGHKVGEIEYEINKLYDKKILDAKEEWSFKIEQVYINMWKRIYDINHNSAQMNFETELRDLETEYQKLQESATKNLDKYTASYSLNTQGLSRPTLTRLGRADGYYSDKDLAIGKRYLDLLNNVKIAEDRLDEARRNHSSTEKMWAASLEENQKKLQRYIDTLGYTQDEMDRMYVVQTLKEENYSKSLLVEYRLRIGDRKKYYAEIERLAIEELDKQYEIEQRKAAENYNNEWRTMVNAYSAQDHELKEHLKKGEITQGQYNEAVERLSKERSNAEIALQDKYNSLKEQREQEHQNKIKQIKSNSYNSQLQEYRDYLSRLNQVDASTPIRDSAGWGIVNISETRKRNDELMSSCVQLASDIVNEKHKLQASLDANEITFDDFQQAQRELNGLQDNVANAMKSIEASNKNLISDFWDSIDQWIQQVGQTMNSILGSLSEIQSNQYDKMIEQQEKYIEEYEELLDKQKDITQEHASAVESIEDELSTARGDRRQQLIDQLNAEMAAQRASLAQEKKIEREKEKAEQKKKKLEHDQAVAKKNMQLAQAAINMAMAISMAAVNSWPVPAIPMMALAAAAGAAQIAAIQSQNIPSYGSGGVIQGKSHREGGVKVLGGQAEVEGGEYITNKVTTAKNVELLEYINTKRKKISLEDLIDFYGGNSQVKKSISTVRTKFADGGMIPTLRNDINLSDRMLTAFEDYSNRPVQVAVVDIIDRTQQVNEVKVMAGLDV